MANANLQAAKAAKKDEFYTQLTDIEKELKHYKEHFHGKTVLCNCDDPRVSQFFQYFYTYFEVLGLKRLITTCYKHQDIDLFGDHSEGKAVYLIYDGDKNHNHILDPDELEVKPLQGDGDFRSKECIELLKQADIVVTNPPFSLFREYVAQLMKYDKKFLIIGHLNAIKYIEIFPLLQQNKIWLGYGFNLSMVYKSIYENKLEANRKYVRSKGYDPNDNYIKVPAVTWYTNLEIDKRKEEITLFRKYTPENYPKYANYDAIEVSEVSDIPMDYFGLIGVPITFLGKYNPSQFEIIGNTSDTAWMEKENISKIGQDAIDNLRAQGNKAHVTANMRTPYLLIDGKVNLPYTRIIIRRKQ